MPPTTAATATAAARTTPTSKFQITTPTVVLDKAKCVANIRRMAAKAAEAGVRLRPHCKTHACLEIAKWMRDEGDVTAITVSSFSMAEYFSKEWEDITVAFPVNILEIDTINRLSAKLAHLNLVVENPEAVDYLESHLTHPVRVWMKIDVGYGRTGIPAEDYARMEPILHHLKSRSQRMEFLGFLAHAGHTYQCRTKENVFQIHQNSKRLLLQLKNRFIGEFPNLQLSLGDTPSCSIVPPTEWEGMDEMRPGNFCFYDLEQASIGSCQPDNIAVAVACPIVAKHHQRHELILYGGGVHFSKDRLSGEPEGTIFGRVVARKASSDTLEWSDIVEGMFLKGVSQEHGKVSVPPAVWDDYQIGDLLFVLPVHSCMAADILKYKGYLTTDGQRLERMKN